MTAAPVAERVARAALSRLTEPGDLRVLRLVREVGAARLVELLRDQRDVEGVHTEVAERLRDIDAERELADAAARGIRFVCPGDEEWPTQVDALDRCQPVDRQGGSPVGLWVRGPVSLAEGTARSVAVVGSRSATTYGADVAGELGHGLVRAGLPVVSGAAFGIDAAAHRGAMAGDGVTVAVLACGVDRAYPAGHQSLLDHVARTGLVVSELPPGCAPTRLRFLTRNRLIAALSLGTVVVEAAVRSGALNTATWAARLGRAVMGVPGPVTSAPSEGVHELIRCREGLLVTRPEHVLELVGSVGGDLAPVRRGAATARDLVTGEQRRVLEAVPVVRGAGVPSIARAGGLSVDATARALDALLALGVVERRGDSWRLARALRQAEDAAMPSGTDGPP